MVVVLDQPLLNRQRRFVQGVFFYFRRTNSRLVR